MDSAASITIYPMILWLYTGQLALQDQMVNDENTTCKPAGFAVSKKSNLKTWQLTRLERKLRHFHGSMCIY